MDFKQISGGKDNLWYEYTEFERNPSLVKITGTPEEAEKEAIDWFINGAKEEVPDVEESKVWEVVEWWKLKNIWKRPLSEDDAKAWRMIRKELKKRIK